MYRITWFIFTMILLLNPLKSIAAGKKIIQESKPRRSIPIRNEEKGRVLRTPLFSSKPVTKATEDMQYTYTSTVTDVNAGGKLQFTAETLPKWLKLNPLTGVLSGTPTNDDVGQHEVLLSVSDGIAPTSGKQAYIITVENVNDMPVFTSTPVETATEDRLYTYRITAEDIDLKARLHFAAQTLPAWLTFNPSGVLTGTPNNDYVGKHRVVLTVSDGIAAPVEQAFTITVNNVNDAPFFTSSPIETATAGVLYTYTVTATDVDASAKLNFAAQTVPAWLNFSPATHSLSGIPSNEDIGEHPVVLTVSDGIAAPVKQAFTIRVARFDPDDGLILKVFANPKNTTLWVSVKDLQRDNYTVVERIKDSERRIPASAVTCKPARTADIPMMSSFLRDLSSSLGDNEILQINAAFQTYIERMPPHEMAQIIDFSDQVTVRQPFTSSRQALKNALSFPQSRGSTAFFDAIIKALLSLDEAPQEALKVVLAFTDGEDNTSTHSLSDVLTMAKAKEIPIFCVGMGNAQESVLRQIALSTHGLYFASPSPETLVLVYGRIANLLDGTYILSYPTQAHLGDEVSATLEYAGGRKTLTHPFVIGQDKNKKQ